MISSGFWFDPNNKTDSFTLGAAYAFKSNVQPLRSRNVQICKTAAKKAQRLNR